MFNLLQRSFSAQVFAFFATLMSREDKPNRIPAVISFLMTLILWPFIMVWFDLARFLLDDGNGWLSRWAGEKMYAYDDWRAFAASLIDLIGGFVLVSAYVLVSWHITAYSIEAITPFNLPTYGDTVETEIVEFVYTDLPSGIAPTYEGVSNHIAFRASQLANVDEAQVAAQVDTWLQEKCAGHTPVIKRDAGSFLHVLCGNAGDYVQYSLVNNSGDVILILGIDG